MQVKIYRPGKTAMQSGRARTGKWLLEPVLSSARVPEPLMGWSASADTDNQVRLGFATAEEALAFARAKGWEATVLPERARKVRPRNYADNFRYVSPAPPSTAQGAGVPPSDRSRSSTG